MLWLICIMVVIPAGLMLAHREHVSFTKISQERGGEQEAET